MKHICVIGAGTMGTQIALTAAIHNYSVNLYDQDEQALERATFQIDQLLQSLVKRQTITSEMSVHIANNIICHSELTTAITESDLIIEAIMENIPVKQQLFQTLDELAPAHTILATNSSMIRSSVLAQQTKRPDKVCNLHFFNPVIRMEAVEVVRGPLTSEDTIEKVVNFVKSIRKTPIILEKEIDGFIANRILSKIMDEAIFLYENGIASPEQIDLACMKALNHPIGPFALMDLTGLDTVYHIRQTQYEITGSESYKPTASLIEKYEAGHFGRKTGQGFYTYVKERS